MKNRKLIFITLSFFLFSKIFYGEEFKRLIAVSKPSFSQWDYTTQPTHIPDKIISDKIILSAGERLELIEYGIFSSLDGYPYGDVKSQPIPSNWASSSWQWGNKYGSPNLPVTNSEGKLRLISKMSFPDLNRSNEDFTVDLPYTSPNNMFGKSLLSFIGPAEVYVEAIPLYSVQPYCAFQSSSSKHEKYYRSEPLCYTVANFRLIRSASEATGPVSSSQKNYVTVIPENSPTDVRIVLEQSTDLINWTSANQGVFSPSTARRFFRVRAEEE